MTPRVCVFDAYGTLFDVASAARTFAASPDGTALRPHWEQVASDWRAKQLEYSWLRTITGHYRDFMSLTGDSLDWALEAAGLADTPGLRAALLELYLKLEAYPEVPDVLAALKARGVALAILSNGSPEMLRAAVGSAGLQGLFEAVLSVDHIGIFKPDDRVYRMVGDRFGSAPGEVQFVSSNGWDIAGAAAFGFRTLWVNRSGAPVDRLFGQPDRIASDLTALPEVF